MPDTDAAFALAYRASPLPSLLPLPLPLLPLPPGCSGAAAAGLAVVCVRKRRTAQRLDYRAGTPGKGAAAGGMPAGGAGAAAAAAAAYGPAPPSLSLSSKASGAASSSAGSAGSAPCARGDLAAVGPLARGVLGAGAGAGAVLGDSALGAYLPSSSAAPATPVAAPPAGADPLAGTLGVFRAAQQQQQQLTASDGSKSFGSSRWAGAGGRLRGAPRAPLSLIHI